MAAILIIDDDITLLTTLGTQIEQAGYTPHKATNIEDAEQLYADMHPDLVLLEVRVGDNAGWELLPRLAAMTPVVVLSADGREEDVVRGLDEGAIDYLAKPYRSGELLARLRVRLATAQPDWDMARVGNMAAVPVAVAVADNSDAMDDEYPTAVVAPVAPTIKNHKHYRRRPTGDEESVFMSETEEMALLRMSDEVPLPERKVLAQDAVVDDDRTLGERLRHERQRRHITLVQAENEIKVPMAYLQAMEDDKFTLLPRGQVALEMLRSYATYLSLDAEPFVEEFQQSHYTPQAEPLPALGGVALPRSLPRWAMMTLAVVLALVLSIGVLSLIDPNWLSTAGESLQNLLGTLGSTSGS